MALSRQQSLNVLIDLQKELDNCTNDWLTAVNAYVLTELELMQDECSGEQIKNAKGQRLSTEELLEQQAYTEFQLACLKITEGELVHFSDDTKVIKNFASMIELLVLQENSPVFNGFMERDRKAKKDLPSIQLVKYAIVKTMEKFFSEMKWPFVFSAPALESIVLLEQKVFIEGKNYDFIELVNVINKLLIPYKIDTHHTDIFEHSILRLAKTSFPEKASFCHKFYDSDTYSEVIVRGYAFMHLGVSSPDIQKTIHCLNEYCGEGAAERFFGNIENVHSLQLNINKVMKKILTKEYSDHLDSFLSKPEVLACYQQKQQKKEISLSQILRNINEVLSTYKVTTKSFAMEASLLFAFGIDKKLLAPRFTSFQEFDSFNQEVSLYLNLTKEEIQVVIANINQQFPNAARWIKANEVAGVQYNTMTIRNEVMVSAPFLEKIREGLKGIAEKNPDVLENFQMVSGTRTETTLQLADQLMHVAEQYRENANYLAMELNRYSLFVKNRKDPAQMKEETFKLGKAIALFESKIETPMELSMFKVGPKKEIKTIQTKLGYRLK